MVINNCKVIYISSFSFQGEITSSTYASSVRFLGTTIDFTVSDKRYVAILVTEVFSGLNVIGMSWFLLIYKISFSVANHLVLKVSPYLTKWLNVHHSTTNIFLYSLTSPCPLSLKSLTSVIKSTKVSGHLLLKDSADKQISESSSQLKCGFWDVTETFVDAECRLEFHKVMGYHETSRVGFGSFKSPSIPRRNSHKYRRLIFDLVSEVDENAYQAKSIQLQLLKNDLSWKTLLATPSSLISFCLGATFDTLPTAKFKTLDTHN